MSGIPDRKGKRNGHVRQRLTTAIAKFQTKETLLKDLETSTRLIELSESEPSVVGPATLAKARKYERICRAELMRRKELPAKFRGGAVTPEVVYDATGGTDDDRSEKKQTL